MKCRACRNLYQAPGQGKKFKEVGMVANAAKSLVSLGMERG